MALARCSGSAWPWRPARWPERGHLAVSGGRLFCGLIAEGLVDARFAAWDRFSCGLTDCISIATTASISSRISPTPAWGSGVYGPLVSLALRSAQPAPVRHLRPPALLADLAVAWAPCMAAFAWLLQALRANVRSLARPNSRPPRPGHLVGLIVTPSTASRRPAKPGPVVWAPILCYSACTPPLSRQAVRSRRPCCPAGAPCPGVGRQPSGWAARLWRPGRPISAPWPRFAPSEHLNTAELPLPWPGRGPLRARPSPGPGPSHRTPAPGNPARFRGPVRGRRAAARGRLRGLSGQRKPPEGRWGWPTSGPGRLDEPKPLHRQVPA